MSEQILIEKDNCCFQDDSHGRYYYKNHKHSLKNNKTYLTKCSRCNDYIYLKDSIFFDKSARFGNPIIHERCR